MQRPRIPCLSSSVSLYNTPSERSEDRVDARNRDLRRVRLDLSHIAHRAVSPHPPMHPASETASNFVNLKIIADCVKHMALQVSRISPGTTSSPGARNVKGSEICKMRHGPTQSANCDSCVSGCGAIHLCVEQDVANKDDEPKVELGLIGDVMAGAHQPSAQAENQHERDGG